MTEKSSLQRDQTLKQRTAQRKTPHEYHLPKLAIESENYDSWVAIIINVKYCREKKKKLDLMGQPQLTKYFLAY